MAATKAKLILPQLLFPVTSKLFFERYREQEHLYLQGKGTLYKQLLPAKMLDAYFNRRDIYPGFIRVVKKGIPVEPDAFTISSPLHGRFPVTDNYKLFDFYCKGHTIIVQKAHLSFHALGKFIDQLEDEMKIVMNANLYLTPKKSQGFEPHYDTHDIFILQLHGKKTWNLYESNFKLPLACQPISRRHQEKILRQQPLLSIEMMPGDILYLPRGIVHETFTTHESSAHLTLGMFPLKVIDLFPSQYRKLKNDPEFRKGILMNEVSKSKDALLKIKNYKRSNKVIKNKIEEHYASNKVKMASKDFTSLFLKK